MRGENDTHCHTRALFCSKRRIKTKPKPVSEYIFAVCVSMETSGLSNFRIFVLKPLHAAVIIAIQSCLRFIMLDFGNSVNSRSYDFS